MGWHRLALDPLGEPPAPVTVGAEDQVTASAPNPALDPLVVLSAEERAELRGWLMRLAAANAPPAEASPAAALLDDAALPVTAATLAGLVAHLERQPCVAFTGAELARLLPFLADLRARCAACPAVIAVR